MVALSICARKRQAFTQLAVTVMRAELIVGGCECNDVARRTDVNIRQPWAWRGQPIQGCLCCHRNAGPFWSPDDETSIAQTGGTVSKTRFAQITARSVASSDMMNCARRWLN